MVLPGDKEEGGIDLSFINHLVVMREKKVRDTLEAHSEWHSPAIKFSPRTITVIKYQHLFESSWVLNWQAGSSSQTVPFFEPRSSPEDHILLIPKIVLSLAFRLQDVTFVLCSSVSAPLSFFSL